MSALDRAAAEDEEELLAISAVTLPYDPDTFVVLRGPHKGQDVTEAEIQVTRGLLARFGNLGVMVETRTVMLCPWWTWWTFTPARRLTPTRVFPTR